MRTLCFLFALGAVVGIHRELDAASDPCAEDGNFPCVAAGKTTDDIADAALKLEKLYAGQPIGYCKRFVQIVFDQINDKVGLPAGYRDAYCTCGYEIDGNEAVSGDVVQISNDVSPADELHVHTAIVQERHPDGTFKVIESNWHLDKTIASRDDGWNPQEWAKTLPYLYGQKYIPDPAERAAKEKYWNEVEKVNWNAHFYRLAPLPGQQTGSQSPDAPLYPVNDLFVGKTDGLGYAVSPIYDGLDGVFQDFQFGRLFQNGANLQITRLAYPQNVGPGQLPPGESDPDELGLGFARTYGRLIEKHGSNRLGFPVNNGGGAYVHTWSDPLAAFNPTVQDFYQPNVPRLDTDGWCALVYAEQGRSFLVRDDFWEEYKQWAWYYGEPEGNAWTWVDHTGFTDANNQFHTSGLAYLRQDFDFFTMLQHPGQPVVSVEEANLAGDVGAGFWADQLDLTGWAVSNRQVYLRSTGGEELDQHGYRSWYVNGTYYSRTYTPELTIIGLEPGATYVFRTEQVQNDEVVAISNDLTLTLPPQDEFSLHVEPKQANAVSISVVNHRFAVVGYYVVNRDGVPITRLTGEACGDYDLDYSRTYTYEVVAMTASHMELGRTNVVTITTQAQPVTPPPPMENAQPATIVLTIDRSEIPALTRTQATATVFDQYGRVMSGPRVLYLSSQPAVATIDADTGEIIAEAEGQVELWAELYDNRDLRSAVVTFTVHRADWTPPVPPVWRGVAANYPLGQDSAGNHWSDISHQAWWSPTDISSPAQWLTAPIVLWRSHLYVAPQHYVTGNPNPVDGFTWYPTDGRLGVYFQSHDGGELYVNGEKVGEWGNPNGFGTQPINRPDLPNSLILPPVELTTYLTDGTNTLVLHIVAGSGAAELTHLEFVNLNAAQNINLPNSGASPSGAVVFADDFKRVELGSAWEACGSVALSANGKVDVVGDNSCNMCGFGSVAGIRRVNFPMLPQPEAVLELFIANNYGGRNNIVYLAFGNFWVGASDHPQSPAMLQIFYRDHEIARAPDVRLDPGWYAFSISGGMARLRSVRLQNAASTAIDLEGDFTAWIDPADPPYISHLCLLGNELGQVSFDDVIVYDLTQPVSPSQTTVPSNLVVTLSLESTTVTADDQPNVLVVVENRSSAAGPSSRLSLTVDGAAERTFTIPELAANGTHAFSVTLDRLPVGDHVVAVVADSDSQIVESDETDNTAVFELTVTPMRRPDLSVSLTLPDSAYVGELIPIILIVPNLGEAPSAPCLLNLGFGGTTEESVYDAEPGQLQFIVPELAPGAEATFSSSLRVSVADTFTLWADVDANAEVRESDETNNTATATMVVHAYPPLASFPSPQYAFSRTEDYTWSGQPYTAYHFTCLNWTDYSDVIFRSEPSVVCGSPGAARTWVDIWAVSASGNKSYLSGYCRFSTALNLNGISFALPRGSLPPPQVCVTFTDEVDRTVLTSNLVSVPRPSANDAWDPADNTVSGAVAVSNPTATEQSHGPHRLASTDYYDWFKVYLTAGRSYNFNTKGGVGDDYGELYSNAAGTTRVAYNDDSGGNYQFSLTYRPTTTGWYYLRVRGYSLGRSCSYTLKYRSL